MNNQSQIRENSEVNNPAPEADEQKGSNPREYDSGKETPIGDSDIGETSQIPAQHEDAVSEGDKMLLDYAYLTSLY